jgi:TonB family protein
MPVIPPVAIQQALPDWRPRDPSAVSREFSGAVKVLIDASGKVTAATIERSIHPEYDRLVLASAQRWSYRPASRGGVAITSEKIVEIRLRTR